MTGPPGDDPTLIHPVRFHQRPPSVFPRPIDMDDVESTYHLTLQQC